MNKSYKKCNPQGDLPAVTKELPKSREEKEQVPPPDKNCSQSGGGCVICKICNILCNWCNRLFKKQNDNQVKNRADTSPASFSDNDVDVGVVLVAMTIKQDIVNDPVTLFQKANSYWIGSKGDWEEKCSQLKNIKTFNTIEDIDTDGFVLVIYETQCPKNHVPQGCLGIRNTLRNQNIRPQYAAVPSGNSTFFHDFKQG